MGVFLSLTAADIAMQIQSDGAEARGKIGMLAAHYEVSLGRIQKLLSLPTADATDVYSITSSLEAYVAAIDQLKAKVLLDVDKIRHPEKYVVVAPPEEVITVPPPPPPPVEEQAPLPAPAPPPPEPEPEPQPAPAPETPPVE